jgi:methyltransferase (TIGR00027 family)
MRDAPAATSLLIAAAACLDAPGDAREALAHRLAPAVLAQAGIGGRMLRALVGHRVGRGVLRALERALLPGLVAHYRWRKRRLAAWAQETVADGVTQVLVLGAGFDVLGLHLATMHPSLVVVEVDRAPTVCCKQQALASAGLTHPRVAMVEADVGDEAGLVPALSRLDPHAPLLVIAEGLLMYLRPETVASLAPALARSMARPPVILATAMRMRPDGTPGFTRQSRLVDPWLRLRGEPFLWGLRPEQAAVQLATLGFHDVAWGDDPRDPDPSPGEGVFRAQLRGAVTTVSAAGR